VSLPSISEFPGGFLLVWAEENLTIKASRLRNHSDGRLTGELLIETTAPGYSPHLHQAQFNFSSTVARDKLAKMMSAIYTEANWNDVLEQLCVYVLKHFRRGEPVKELWSSDEIQKPQYLLYPIVQKGQPTIIFGDGGSGKSYFALLAAITISLPWEDNPLGLIPALPGCIPLYLDWEADENTHRWRLKQIQQGCDLPGLRIHYRECALPLPDDIERIRDLITETKAEFIIIDSLGAAAGGDLNTAEAALRFISSLRQLHVTSLIIAHNSKDPNTNTKSIFGSVYFRNGARIVDELKSFQDPEQSHLEMALFARKANNSKFHRPLGLRLLFDEREESLSVSSCDIRTIPELAEHLTMKTRVREALKAGSLAFKDICESLSLSKDKLDYLSVTLNKMAKEGLIIKLPANQWGLRAEE